VCDISVPENVVKLLGEWQVSHGILVGRWFTGLAFGVTPVKLWPLWQLVQLPKIPVCVITPEPGPNPAWQVEHTCVVGKCPIGGVVRPAIKKVVVEVWQLAQSSVVIICAVGASALVFGVTPIKLWPLWQLVQLLTIPAWFISVPANPPGLVLLAEWHISHGMLVGKWVDGILTGVTPTKLCPLWQLAQPATTPVWFIIPAMKLPWLWHNEQACVVGR